MFDKKVAKRYARALLAALRKPEEAEHADRFLTGLAAALTGSAQLRSLFMNPAVPRGTKKAALVTLARQSGASPLLEPFFKLIVDNRRVPALPSIAAVFHAEREQALGIVPATVTSASPLAKDQTARMQTTLEHLTGRQVRLHFEIDPAILGGAITKIGSTVYDGSLRTQLADLRRSMVQE
jgi:F-type H+-transporting ATPase subunit delta